MTGRLIIISSPSGGGKGTIIREVRSKLPDLGFSVSHTTRPRRSGEVEGKDYYFVSRAEFEGMVTSGAFLEHAEVHGNCYGTSLAEVENSLASGQDLIVEIDVQGALQILGTRPEQCVSIFIMPPSFEVLEARLTARGTEGSEQLQVRLRNAFKEIREYEKFTYLVVNRDVLDAAGQVISIILAERQTRNRQVDQIQGILDSFDASEHRF